MLLTQAGANTGRSLSRAGRAAFELMSQHADFLEFKELSLRLRGLNLGGGGGTRGCCRPLCRRSKNGRGGGGSSGGGRTGGVNGGAQGGEEGEYVPWWWFNDTEDTGGGGGGGGGWDDGDVTDAGAEVVAMANPIHLPREQKAASGGETKGDERRVVNPLYARMSSSSTRGGSASSLRSLGSLGSFSSSNTSFTHSNAMSGGDSTDRSERMVEMPSRTRGTKSNLAAVTVAPAEMERLKISAKMLGLVAAATEAPAVTEAPAMTEAPAVTEAPALENVMTLIVL